jgi:hypothetical protein
VERIRGSGGEGEICIGEEDNGIVGKQEGKLEGNGGEGRG